VGNTPGVLPDTTADFAWALLMSAARRVVEGDKFTRAGKWQTWGPIDFLGPDITGATVGIVGFGRIGQGMAKRAQGFDMRILYFDTQRYPEAELKYGVQYVDMTALLRESDFLVLLLPYSPATHHCIGAAELALMKPTAHLINVARGGIVDDEALISALRQGGLAGAGLDVVEGEPKFNPGFLELDNVALTPHIGSSSRATRMAMAMRAADNLIAALAGQRPPNLLNPEVIG
jgi:lactate dehydrogenase-like 2-hydroxyacid dehydrogenase